MALLTTTGNPPAVTHDQIKAWTKLADDVTAALTMGGQQGFDFLTNIMAEWCEAVDDVNAARQICIEMADRGLRHEAIDWHAHGFFEVADRLDPERPGWDAWAAAFAERQMVTPRMEPTLKELANRIHEDLQNEDASGSSLEDYLRRLRRHVLLRGHLGERLVILDSIQGLDPSPPIWQEMMSPIRRRRVDAIANEVKGAIDRRDFEALRALRAEVGSQDWGTDLPATVSALLASTFHCDAIGDILGQLSQAAGIVVARFEEAQRQPAGGAGQAALAEAAAAARKKYAELRKSLLAIVQAAAATPEATALVAESGAREAVKRLDIAIRQPCAWLDQYWEASRARAVGGDIEAAILRQIESAPALGGDREAFASQLKQWKNRTQTTLEQARRAAARLPGGATASIDEVFRRLGVKDHELDEHLERLKRRERTVVMYFFLGLGAFVLLVVGGVVLAVIRGR